MSYGRFVAGYSGPLMNKLFDLIFSEKEGTSSKHKHTFRIKNSTTFCVACKAKVSHKIHRDQNIIL